MRPRRPSDRCDQHVAVCLARTFAHLRVGGTGDQVLGERGWRSLQLDRARRWPTRCPCPARAAPRSAGADGTEPPTGRMAAGGVAAPWAMTWTLDGSTPNSCDQAVAPAGGHDHDGVGGGADARVRTARCWEVGCLQHGVGHHHRRHLDGVHQSQDLVAVCARVDAVLVLDDGDVGAVEHLDAAARTGLADRSSDARTSGSSRPAMLGHPHHVHGVAPGDEAGRERSREGGDATRGRREGPDACRT